MLEYHSGVLGNLRGSEGMWGYFGGSTTKIPPYLPLTPAIPREPNSGELDFSSKVYNGDPDRRLLDDEDT